MKKERIIKRFERNGCKIVYTKLTNKILVSHKEFIKVFPSLNKAYQTIFNKPKEVLYEDKTTINRRLPGLSRKEE